MFLQNRLLNRTIRFIYFRRLIFVLVDLAWLCKRHANRT
jgi:hypothetical protein